MADMLQNYIDGKFVDFADVHNDARIAPAAVWTRDIKKGLNTAKALRAGIVWINDSQPTETP